MQVPEVVPQMSLVSLIIEKALQVFTSELLHNVSFKVSNFLPLKTNYMESVNEGYKQEYDCNVRFSYTIHI